MAPPTRRDFLTTATACLLCPHTLAAVAAQNTAPITAGKLSDYSQDGVTDKYAASNGFFLIRQDNRLYATSSICTHRVTGRLVSRPKDHDLACPKHGSLFTLQGIVTKGPARKSLPRYAISTNDQHDVIIDTSKQFDEDHWSDPASYLPV